MSQRDRIIKAFADTFPVFDWDLREDQIDVIQQVISEQSTLCVMPTGGGKSIIYWLAGTMLGGMTIVVSPLIALIDEQSQKLEEHGIGVSVLHSGVPQGRQISILKGIYSGEAIPDFLFISPERLATDGLFEAAVRRVRHKVRLFVIDEIHCVSQWGLDFRPFYRRIPRFLSEVWQEEWPHILGLTATLNGRDIEQICKDFRIGSPSVIRSPTIIRGEIQLHIIRLPDESAKEERLWDFLEIHGNAKTLIYVYRKYKKHGAEDLAKKARERGYSAAHFHADMSSLERSEIITAFRSDEVSVIFATNAFGMGIDIPDIRTVIHFMIPESVEQYYQEIGRAARDGNPADAYLLLTDKNIDVRRSHFIDKSFPSEDDIKDGFSKLTGDKEGIRSLKYFDEESIQQSLHYLEEHGAIVILCRAIATTGSLTEIESQELQKIHESTRTKSTVAAANRTNRNIDEVSTIVFEAILDGSATVSGSLEKCLIVRSRDGKLDDKALGDILADIESKREYKHQLLDYLVRILDICNGSNELHQEIGLYLGVDKHLVARIHATTRGEKVRSKSEVIIANLLHARGIDYEYERRLYLENGDCIEPDFTIDIGEKTIYWEHLGMLGLESYDRRWIKKKQIYERYYPGQLVTTHESGSLSDAAAELIDRLVTN